MLYLIATPIGNLGDMSQRALETLRKVTVIAAEDTRSVRRLLAAFNIPADGKQLVAYGDHNEAAMAPRLAALFGASPHGTGGGATSGTGEVDIAVVSEGGTPLVSDPGYRLVQAAIAAGVPVVPIPGPSALLAALAGSGLPVHGFIFRGFLPKKPGARRRILESLKDREETLIFYESPQRVPKVLPEFVEIFGPERPACLARELTKIHETFLRLPLGELSRRVSEAPLKGECTLLVAGVQRGTTESADGADGDREDEAS